MSAGAIRDKGATTPPATALVLGALILGALILIALLTACAPPAPRPATRGPRVGPEPLTAADIARVFRAHGVTGCFVLHEVTGNTTVRHNAPRARRRMLPASTFKIPHALIAVETGVIRDEGQVLRWSGKTYGIAAWNRNHTLRSALQHSVVWAFQGIARQVGRQRMQRWIHRIGYGNRNITGPIDLFWLEPGRLAISAEEQVAFLRRFQSGTLPFSKRTQRLVREALVVERGTHHVLRAKTGWALRKTAQHGWYVGWVERGPRVWVFAMNMDGHFRKDQRARITISRAVLRRAGALP